MKFSALLSGRIRGFRILDLVALVLFLSLALTVYAFKTSAGRERTDITDIESQIHEESRQVQRLRAEVARLESPARLERLATAYADQAPVSARQEVSPEALPDIAQTGAKP